VGVQRAWSLHGSAGSSLHLHVPIGIVHGDVWGLSDFQLRFKVQGFMYIATVPNMVRGILTRGAAIIVLVGWGAAVASAAACPARINGTDFLNTDHQTSTDAVSYTDCCG
jgi:hypothetical protein